MEGELRRKQMLQWCVKRLEPLAYDTKVPTRFIYFTFFGGRRKIDNSCIVSCMVTNMPASSTFIFLGPMLILLSCLGLEYFYSKV